MKITIVELKKILDEILEELKQDCRIIGFPEIVDEPTGNKQSITLSFCNHEFVDQTKGYFEDDYSGYVYFPIDGKYIKIYYES